ncbi:hypothetical protein [Streptomyces aidingensis]|uniref:Excreted virulence factor EspC, type VII ESX diderm n=1 Tax=Streptomyces aidingensis TaxID=910347 RepID=A0A1I1R492_9ACTN|nr:hypothetical protein [Streptomyces aidingensis]SFD29105.1 hypothetical protein SAMN05421773_112172 [Streptomyces aidingensis]
MGHGEPDLRLKYDDIVELGRKLRFVATEFENSESIASDYADEVGHDNLAHELEEFADNWHHKRRAMMDELEAFAGIVESAEEAFGDLDQALYDALTGEG